MEVTPLVSVTIVTFNSQEHIRQCLDTVFSQNYTEFEVIVVDNASSDDTIHILRNCPYPVQLEFNKVNQGFARGQNQAMRRARGEWILCLNPDSRLTPTFVTELVRAAELETRIGAVCPKILRLENNSVSRGPVRLDSTGVWFSRSLRHYDRGSQEIDAGQYDSPDYVFGFTGAAVLLRRTMIEDVSVDGEFFDEDFFAFREDADVSWRAQLLGWKCLYTPYAVACHVRRSFPDNRRRMPAYINMHNVKNRFLMRIKNMTPAVYRKVFLKATARDIGVLAYTLVREWRSIPGLWYVLKRWRSTWEKRRKIQNLRCVSDDEIAAWFSDAPVTFALAPKLASRLHDSRRELQTYEV